jgi:hypothetical protein
MLAKGILSYMLEVKCYGSALARVALFPIRLGWRT